MEPNADTLVVVLMAAIFVVSGLVNLFVDVYQDSGDQE